MPMTKHDDKKRRYAPLRKRNSRFGLCFSFPQQTKVAVGHLNSFQNMLVLFCLLIR